MKLKKFGLGGGAHPLHQSPRVLFLEPGTFKVDLDIINVHVTCVLDKLKYLETVIEIKFEN